MTTIPPPSGTPSIIRHAGEALALGGAFVGVAVVLLTALLVATGHDATRALAAFANGAFGSYYAITSATLVRAIPLALAGLGVAIAFRAGILNVGAEGQLLIGATAAATVAQLLGATASSTPAITTGTHTPIVANAIVANAILANAIIAVPAMLIAGATAGAMWSGIAAWLRQRFGVLEVISTIMLNFVATEVVGYLVRGPLQEPTGVNPQSASLATTAMMPVLLPDTRLHAGAAIAVALAAALAWWLANTREGFRLRATGLNPSAAAVSGRIPVPRVIASAFLASGAIAGLAGAVEYSGVTYALYQNLSPGYGYTAIAVALLARLHPIGILGAAVLFGAMEAGANAMQRDAGVPNVVVSVVEAALIIALVLLDRWRERRNASAASAMAAMASAPS